MAGVGTKRHPACFVAEPDVRLDLGELTFEPRSLNGGGRGHREEMLLAPPSIIANVSDPLGSGGNSWLIQTGN